MTGKGRGWWGERGRHSQAARGHKTAGPTFHQEPFTPTMSIDGHMVVALLERPAGVSVRWAESLRDAVGPSDSSQVARMRNLDTGETVVIGDNQSLLPHGVPDTDYAVLEEDDEFVFLAAMLHNGRASAKHRYLVTRKEWQKAIKKSGGKFF